ncbi:Phosphate-specific outer membrane porin OprP; Pyrophosphate-specific outer membrane porin OprO [hydrothermal vent metagenome]|uniref:Phosphate-specific outer membrane porin OprP Pyrophosphate-specific outer membrane porin OprO n=1 Tax=hydrothermal vent metagenome TaxID=652676 RepID=A0A1W1BXU7_9ZZZZ
MSKFLFFLFVSLTLLHAQKTCYTVELISAVNNKSNKERLEQKNYDSSCKVMTISNMLSVRCGCFNKYKDAKKHLKSLKREYKDAYVRTTYASRFATKQAIQKKPVLQPKKAQREDIAVPVETILQPVQEENMTHVVVQAPISTEIKKQDKVKKKNKKKKNKKKKNKKKKNKKNKKKKKVKYIKLRAASYNYQKYLHYLSNKRPIRPYGYLYSFGGQISYDLGYIDQTPAKYSDFPQPYSNRMWRRIRFDHEGSFFDKKLFYKFEYSFTGTDRYKDVYFGYQDKFNSETFYRIKAGNIKIPYSLQRYSSSKNLSFMERPLGDDAFSIGRELGLEIFLNIKLQQHLFGLFLASYTNSIDERNRNEANKSGNSLRVTYTYKVSKRHLFHVGIGFLNEDLKNNTLRYKQNSESKIMNEKYVSTKIKHVENRNVRNLDILYLNNRYYCEAGYMDSIVDAKKGAYRFYSYFLEGSYFFIGRGKRFDTKESKFSKIKTTKDGALELALRYSHINLNDKDEQGGQQTNYSASLNWYLTTEFKMMFNYIRALPKETDDYDGVINIYQMRFLFAF